MNKKILITLGISLAFNFIFIGFETAKIMYQPTFPKFPAERPDFMRPNAGKPDFRMPPMMREAFTDAMKQNKEAMMSAKQEIEDALKAEPFDAGQLKAALQKATAARAAIDAAAQESMVEAVSQMSAKERTRFADKFSHKGKKWFGKKAKHHKGKGKRPEAAPHDRPGFHHNKGGIPFEPPCMRDKPQEAPMPCPNARPFEKKPCPCQKRKGQTPPHEMPVPENGPAE